MRWGKREARVNTISPGIIITPLARDELTGPRGEGYRRMLELAPAGRAGTPDEVGTIGALLMGADGAFITGSDFLVDGGVTASFFYGELANERGANMEHGAKRPTTKGSADWFAGDVYVDTVAEGHGASPAMVAFVQFTPEARTAWHSHSIGQSLYVTEGEDRIQTRREPIVTLHTGDTVFALGGEWHWHGQHQITS